MKYRFRDSHRVRIADDAFSDAKRQVEELLKRQKTILSIWKRYSDKGKRDKELTHFFTTIGHELQGTPLQTAAKYLVTMRTLLEKMASEAKNAAIKQTVEGGLKIYNEEESTMNLLTKQANEESGPENADDVEAGESVKVEGNIAYEEIVKRRAQILDVWDKYKKEKPLLNLRMSRLLRGYGVTVLDDNRATGTAGNYLAALFELLENKTKALQKKVEELDDPNQIPEDLAKEIKELEEAVQKIQFG